MSIVTVNFEKCLKRKKTYKSSTNDTWTHKADVNCTPGATRKYCHFITLVARNDGKDLPIETIYHDDIPDCMIRQFFSVGDPMVVASNKENLQLIYVSPEIISKTGSLASDLINYSTLNENVQLISSDDQAIFINKFLFESRSQAFQEMIARAKEDGKEDKVKFEDVDSSVLKDLVAFLKTDKVPHLSSTAIQLGHIAEKFKLPKLCHLVESYLKCNITRENFEKVRQLAARTKSEVL